MSSLALGSSAAPNPRNSAVSKIHAHYLWVNAVGKGENPLLVLVSTLAGLVLFYLLITSHERSTVLSWLATVWIVYERVKIALSSRAAPSP
jgi:hypothetical protein